MIINRLSFTSSPRMIVINAGFSVAQIIMIQSEVSDSVGMNE